MQTQVKDSPIQGHHDNQSLAVEEGGLGRQLIRISILFRINIVIYALFTRSIGTVLVIIYGYRTYIEKQQLCTQPILVHYLQ